MHNQLSDSEWLLVHNAMELLNAAWDDEQVLSAGVAKILKGLIDADSVVIGCTDLGTAIHKSIFFEGNPDAFQEAQTLFQRNGPIASAIDRLQMTNCHPPVALEGSHACDPRPR